MNRKIKLWIKPICFLLGLVLVFSLVQSVFKVEDKRIPQTMKGFYAEEDGTLDAVYIGASNVYSYWQGPLAWEEYGMTVYSMSLPNMPAQAIKYMIEECRKTQPDALYIVNLNNFKDLEIDETKIHYLTNYMPLSRNKINLINDLCEEMGITSISDKLEYALPIIRFHSGWNELTQDSFSKALWGYKGASVYKKFLAESKDISEDYHENYQYTNTTAKQDEVLEDLFTYCEEEDLNILFVCVPQGFEDESTVTQLNTLCDKAENRGFDVLNIINEIDDIGLDIERDFYNNNHTNIHGSIKYTHYLGGYLKEKYGFEDKRGNPDYISWDEAASKYNDVIVPYTLDFEKEFSSREYDMEVPALTECNVLGQSIELKWELTSDADGYHIYRKNASLGDKAKWECVAEVEKDVNTITDRELELNKEYVYTVVPVKHSEGNVLYGNFDVIGIKGKTTLDAPKLISAEKTDAGIVITWEEVEKADSYIIYRKINGEKWVQLDTVNDSLSYTDIYCQDGLPYVYSVAAQNSKYVGAYDMEGLLVKEDIESPVLTGAAIDNSFVLQWKSIKGADAYSVYRMDDGGKWELIAEQITELSYTEISKDESCLYKVSAVISNGEQVYEYDSNELKLEKEER